MIHWTKVALCMGMASMVVGCGGPDLDTYCEESASCVDEMGFLFGLSISTFQDFCVESAEQGLDSLSSEEEQQVEKVLEECKPKTSCDYVACAEMDEAVLALNGQVLDNAQGECGDGIADVFEDCDGSDLWGDDCDGVSFGDTPGGTLACNPDCTYDTSACE